jgi:hypothetical protein
MPSCAACTAFCTALFTTKSRSQEIGLGHLQKVLLRDQSAFADPSADNVQRERRGKFRFPACP